MMDNGKMIKKMEQENINGLTETNMKEIGIKI